MTDLQNKKSLRKQKIDQYDLIFAQAFFIKWRSHQTQLQNCETYTNIIFPKIEKNSMLFNNLTTEK